MSARPYPDLRAGDIHRAVLDEVVDAADALQAAAALHAALPPRQLPRHRHLASGPGRYWEEHVIGCHPMSVQNALDDVRRGLRMHWMMNEEGPTCVG